MKEIYKEESLPIPDGVKVEIKSRTITVTGPRGTLTKAIKHIAMDVQVVRTKKASVVKLVVWHGGRKHVACLRTVKSLVENMIIGTTKGFNYKVRRSVCLAEPFR